MILCKGTTSKSTKLPELVVANVYLHKDTGALYMFAAGNDLVNLKTGGKWKAGMGLGTAPRYEFTNVTDSVYLDVSQLED